MTTELRLAQEEQMFEEIFLQQLDFLERSTGLTAIQKHSCLMYLRLILEENRSWLTGTVTRSLRYKALKLGSSESFKIKEKKPDAQLLTH